MMDVDAVQNHFSSYFRWMDLAASGLLSQLGMPIRELLAAGYSLPVVAAHCDYRAPVRLGSVVTCTSYYRSGGRTSLLMRNDFTCDGELVATGDLSQVWMEPVDGKLVSAELPVRLRTAIWPADAAPE
jgi:acyl-CoA thioester hydrolase